MNATEFGKALVDFRNAIGTENFSKAISITQPSYPGLTSREDLQDDLVIAGPMDCPLTSRLPRETGNGEAHAFWRLQPNADRSQGIFYGTTPGNAVFPMGGLPQTTTEDYVRIAIPYENLGDVAKVPWQAQAEARSYTDLMAQRVKVKAKNVKLMENFFGWWGDNTVTTYPGGGRIFDGLLKQLRTQGGVLNTPTDGKLSIGLIRQACKQMYDNGGVGSVVFVDTKGFAILNAQVANEYAIRQTGNSAMGAAQMGKKKKKKNKSKKQKQIKNY